MVDKIMFLSSEKTFALESLLTRYITNMTSNTTPSPFVASASSESNANYQAWKAFNGTFNENPTDVWATASGDLTGWIQIDYGKGIDVDKVSFSTHSDYLLEMPKDFDIEYSNNGVEFSIIAEIRGQTNWKTNEIREFSFSRVTSRYWRVNVKSVNSSNHVAISEIQFGLDSSILKEVGAISESNFINHGMTSPFKTDNLFSSKNYILQDIDSENDDGLLTVQIDRKPISIKFE